LNIFGITTAAAQISIINTQSGGASSVRHRKQT